MIDYSSGPAVMLTLGSFQFSILTAAYQEFNQVSEYRWGKQDRFGQLPALQFVGLGDDTISLPGVIYPEFRGGLTQLDTLRELAATGVPQTLIDGRGNVKGRWAIERIEERASVFAAAGVARKQEFTLSLRRFDALPPAAAITLAPVSIGDINISPPASIAATAAESQADTAISTAAKIAESLGSAMTRVQAVADQIGGAVGGIVTPIQRCFNVANGLRNAARDSRGMLDSTRSALSQANSLQSLLSATTSAVANSSQSAYSLRRATDALVAVPPEAMAVVRGASVVVNRMVVGVTKLQAGASKALKDQGA